VEFVHSRLIASVIQMQSENGRVAKNLAQAEHHIRSAVHRDAALILLPELLPNGFELTEDWWNTATAFDGPIVCWISEQARSHRVHIGMTFLEAEGDHFYNTFVLASPSGKIVGKTRKAPPASFEAFFYRAGETPHVIETEIGRIGIGICYENLLYERLEEFHAAKVDLVLQPMSAPLPELSFPMRRSDIARFARDVAELPLLYARTLKVPVLMANKCGPFYSRLPAIRKEYRSTFPGLSSIVNSDGALCGRLDTEEDVLVAAVDLGRDETEATSLQNFGGRVMPRPWFAFLFGWTQRKGEQSYIRNSRRPAAARAVQSGPNQCLEPTRSEQRATQT
jgi:N-carbamoylputrescine amidase